MTEAAQVVVKVFTLACSIVVVGAQTCCALFHFVRDLKTSQMNVQYTLIRKLMLHAFELGHNAAEAIKNTCREKGEAQLITVTRCFKKFRLGCTNLKDQGLVGLKASIPKLCSKPNPTSSAQRVSGELSISRFCMVCHLLDRRKSM